MKKLFVVAVILLAFVSSAFASLNDDLIQAVQNKYTSPKRIQSLIKSGADINARDDEGYTVLTLAVIRTGNIKAIKALIDSGADVNARHDDLTALMFAAQLSNNPEVIKTLINGGADPNSQDNNGMTGFNVRCSKSK